MKVILLKDVVGQGKAGQVVEVSEGYARNFIIKKGLGEEATPVKLNLIKQREESMRIKEEKDRAEALRNVEKLKDVIVPVKVKCGENDKLYGTVTNTDVAEGLKAIGIDVDKKKITLEPIKTLGVYVVDVKLHQGVVAKVKVSVQRA